MSGGPARLVARRSRRGAASPAWELDLLEFLTERGSTAPGARPRRRRAGRTAAAAADAWETAAGWAAEPAYVRSRLARLRAHR